MRVPLILTFFTLLIAPALLAEDADEVRERGVTALKESQANPRSIVEAARLFVKAGELYNTAGNEEKVVEMNSFLYWCKKKMTLEDIDAFTKGGEAHVTSKLAAVEKDAPKDDAQKWFDRAEQFAKKYPGEHLLIAVRFFEVADRFKGSDPALQAMDRSLKELLQEKSGGVKTGAQPTSRPADSAAAEAGKRAIPNADDLKKSEKLLKDVLKDEFSKSDNAGRLALVTKLLQQAEENKKDAAVEYVCLHEARDTAVLAGDAGKAAEVQTRLNDAFKSDFAATMLDLKKLDAVAKTAEPATALATLYAHESIAALAAGDYDHAVRFNSRAEDLLPLSKDAALKTRMKTEIPRVQAIKKESTAALAAQKTLATKPDDPEANLTAGKFALLLGDMDKCMPMLAKSKDATLSDLAKNELTPPNAAAEQTALADGWFDRAEKETSPFLKTRMQERAALWYTSALPASAGIAKLKIEGRLKTLPGAETAAGSPAAAPAKTTAAPVSGKSVNLLKVVDVTKDAVKGDWKIEGDGSLSGTGTLQLPFTPGNEYDLNVSFTPQKSSDNGVSFVLAKNGHQCMVSFGSWYNKVSAISFISGKWGNQNNTKTDFGLENGHKYQASMKVRKDVVSVFVDGKLLFEHKSDGSDFTITDDWRMKSDTAIGIRNARPSSFDSIEIIDISGKGTLERTKSATPNTSTSAPIVGHGNELVELPADEVTASKSIGPGNFKMKGTIAITDKSRATLTISPGTTISNGTFEMRGTTLVYALGTDEKPTVFRNVTFDQYLVGGLVARGVIFDNCTFKKIGGFFSYFSTRWRFYGCTLNKCRFPNLNGVDYGIMFQSCVLIGMKVPELVHRTDEDYPKYFRSDWNQIGSCCFYDCQIPPTIFFCAEQCSYLNCKFVPGGPVPLDKDWPVEALVVNCSGTPPAATKSGPAKVVQTKSLYPGPFPPASNLPELAPAYRDIAGMHRGYKWISKTATYTWSSADYVEPSPALLSGEPVSSAVEELTLLFCSKNEQSPFIVIDLGAAHPIAALDIENRSIYIPRAKTLTAWVSDNSAGPWEEIWTNGTPNRTHWAIVLDKPKSARYVKLGVTEKTYLQLNSVRIFEKH